MVREAPSEAGPLSGAGPRSRDAILREAARLVTVEGIDGLSISRLADAVGLSKSGLFAHFKSKEELQLATIETAERIFHDEVVAPAVEAGTGAQRLRALCEEFLAHLERGVFPGGCFFASVMAEADTHPGPVRDRALSAVADWFGELEAAARQAQDDGDIASGEDVTQIAYELDAYLLFANARYIASGSRDELDRGRDAVERLLRWVAPVRPRRARRGQAGSAGL